jgi:hypothetical protein
VEHANSECKILMKMAVSLFRPHFQNSCFAVSLFRPHFPNSCFAVSLVSPKFFLSQILFFFLFLINEFDIINVN